MNCFFVYSALFDWRLAPHGRVDLFWSDWPHTFDYLFNLFALKVGKVFPTLQKFKSSLLIPEKKTKVENQKKLLSSICLFIRSLIYLHGIRVLLLSPFSPVEPTFLFDF